MLNRRVWTSQPQGSVGVNWANPITRGLLQLSLTTAGTNVVPRNLVGAGANYISDFPGTASSQIGVGSLGVGAVKGTYTADNGGSAAGKGYRPDCTSLNSIWSASGEATVLAVLRVNAPDASGYAGAMVLPSSSGDAHHYPYTDGKLYTGPLVIPRYVSAVVPPSSVYVPHTLVATHKINVLAASYFNGVLIGSTTHNEVPYVRIDGTCAIGGNGAVYLIAIWNRALFAAEAALVGVNPWQLFAPLSRPIFAPSAAAAGSTITTATLPAGVGHMGSGQTRAIQSAGVSYMG